MEFAALESSPVGALIRITGRDPRFNEDYDHVAYLPDPLPSSLRLNHATYRAVTAATAAVARLDQAAIRLPNPALLARPAIRSEAVSTSALEGTYAALDEVMEADFLDRKQLSASVAEVRNYVEAAETAFEWVDEKPITLGLLESLQKLLVRETPADTANAGRLRDTQVFIGASTGRVRDARFIPPPPGDQLRSGVDAWMRWINADNDFDLIVKMAVGHYQFETLHPFNEGNGRLGRLVCVLQLAVRRELRVPILNLSPWLETRRGEYQDHLLRCSITGEFDPWIEFFCEAVRAQALDAVEKIDALHDWRDTTLAHLREHNVRGVALQIADELIGFPYVTPRAAAERHGVSYPAANNAIGRLVQIGVLEERTGRKYGRMFLARAVMDIINS